MELSYQAVVVIKYDKNFDCSLYYTTSHRREEADNFEYVK